MSFSLVFGVSLFLFLQGFFAIIDLSVFFLSFDNFVANSLEHAACTVYSVVPVAACTRELCVCEIAQKLKSVFAIL